MTILLSFPTWLDVGFREKTRGRGWESTRDPRNPKSTAVRGWRVGVLGIYGNYLLFFLVSPGPPARIVGR